MNKDKIINQLFVLVELLIKYVPTEVVEIINKEDPNCFTRLEELKLAYKKLSNKT